MEELLKQIRYLVVELEYDLGFEASEVYGLSKRRTEFESRTPQEQLEQGEDDIGELAGLLYTLSLKIDSAILDLNTPS